MKTLLDEEISNQVQNLLSGQNKDLSFVDAIVKIYLYFILRLFF